MSENTSDMRVWIGCLACYNAGDLVGDWFPADEAGDITPTRVHIGGDIHPDEWDTHEELWVMDHEGLPVSGEMSPHEAQAWADLMNEVDDDERGAFAAHINAEGFAVDAVSVEDFRDAYAGEWGSREDFADDLADQCGVNEASTDDMPLGNYWSFDSEMFARDLFFSGDYSDTPAPGGGVYVFRSM